MFMFKEGPNELNELIKFLNIFIHFFNLVHVKDN